MLRVPQDHLHSACHDISGHSPSNLSPNLYLRHTHSPCQSEYFFSQGTPTAQFSSPPPPPYSPHIPPSLRSDPYRDMFSPTPHSQQQPLVDTNATVSYSNGTSPILSPHQQWGLMDGTSPVPVRAPPSTTGSFIINDN